MECLSSSIRLKNFDPGLITHQQDLLEVVMYADFYGFTKEPFQASLDPEFFFLRQSINEILAATEHCSSATTLLPDQAKLLGSKTITVRSIP